MKTTTIRSSSPGTEKRAKIYCAAVNEDKIRGREEEMPYELHSDIAVIYYFMEMRDNVHVVVPVTNEMLIDFELSPEELKKLAWKNTVTKKRATLHLLSDFLGEEEDHCGLYVISNEDMYYGAVTIFYPGLLSVIAEELGSDLFVLPSSVHECLLLPCGGALDQYALTAIVQAVNETEVAEEDVLSSHVYRYSRKDDCMFIDI